MLKHTPVQLQHTDTQRSWHLLIGGKESTTAGSKLQEAATLCSTDAHVAAIALQLAPGGTVNLQLKRSAGHVSRLDRLCLCPRAQCQGGAVEHARGGEDGDGVR